MAVRQIKAGVLRRPAGAGGDEIDRAYVIAGLVLTAGLLAGCMLLLNEANMDVWTGIITFLVIAAVAVPILRWVARKEADPGLFPLLFGGLMAKLGTSLIRYFVIFVVYSGSADAGLYNGAGIDFVKRFQQGVPIHPLPTISAFTPEVQRIGDLTGLVYIVTGPSVYAGFFVFSAFCFTGQVFFLRALKTAVPEADYRRYAKLILFLPSLLFWPSSIGKEAVMLLCLGLITYGAAHLLGPRPKVIGGMWFAIGLGLVLLIRPHIAAISVGALLLATTIGVVGTGQVGGKGRTIRLLALVGLVVIAGGVSTAVSSSFSGQSDESVSLSSDGSPRGAQSELQRTLEQTSIGGSSFSAPAASSPQKLPWAVISVLLRPFPWEVSSLTSLISVGEGMLLAFLLFKSRRRLMSFPQLAMRRPFLIFTATFVVVFSVAFSFIGNFGILARQRTQMLPAALVMLALPALPRRRLGAERDDDPAVASEGVAVTMAESEGMAVAAHQRATAGPISIQRSRRT